MSMSDSSDIRLVTFRGLNPVSKSAKSPLTVRSELQIWKGGKHVEL
jgi:hypothetical protein